MNENYEIKDRISQIEEEILHIFSLGVLDSERLTELMNEKNKLQEKCSHFVIDNYANYPMCLICHKIIE